MNASNVSLIALAVIVSMSQVAEAAAPFGVEMGTPITAYPSCKRDASKDGLYNCATLPRPHSAFEKYGLMAHPSTGVCKVIALGNDVEEAGHGLQVRAAVDAVVAQLAETYGKPTSSYDFLTNGSIWNEMNEWVMGIKQKERFYAFFWSDEEGFVEKNDVKVIFVDTSALSNRIGFVSLALEFSNFERCSRALEQKDKSAF